MKLHLHEKIRLQKKRFNLGSKDHPILYDILINDSNELIVGGSQIISFKATVKNVILVVIGDIKIPVEPNKQTISMSVPIQEISKAGCIDFIGSNRSLQIKIKILTNNLELGKAIEKTLLLNQKKQNEKYLFFSENSAQLKDQLELKNLIHFYE